MSMPIQTYANGIFFYVIFFSRHLADPNGSYKSKDTRGQKSRYGISTISHDSTSSSSTIEDEDDTVSDSLSSHGSTGSRTRAEQLEDSEKRFRDTLTSFNQLRMHTEKAVPKNVTGQTGQPVYLHCIVEPIGDKTVSFFLYYL